MMDLGTKEAIEPRTGICSIIAGNGIKGDLLYATT
jgi:hypothetical protein